MQLGHYELIKKLGSNLALGESFRTVCPECKGGSNNEKCFSIARVESGVVYNCFRAKCGIKGLVGETYRPHTGTKKSKIRPVYSGRLVNLPGAVFARFFLKYDISIDEVQKQGIKYAYDKGRILFPIYDYRGYTIGENLRALSPRQKPKAIINRFSENGVLLHMPLGIDLKEELVLVEDQTSAIKVNKVKACAALLGTNLTFDGLSLLKQIGIRKIILMLDSDNAGIAASIDLQAQLNPFFNVVNQILPQGKDPKDLPYEEIRKIICD